MSADIGFAQWWPCWSAPLTAIRPLTVIGNHTFASAAHQHFWDALTRTDRRFGVRFSGKLRMFCVALSRRSALHSSIDEASDLAAVLSAVRTVRHSFAKAPVVQSERPRKSSRYAQGTECESVKS